MTKIEYIRTANTHYMTIKGHAGYDEHGKDIVCSAVSAIAWTLIGYMESHCKLKRWEARGGEFMASTPRGAEADVAFEMAAIGLEQIARKYPQYVDYHRAAQGG